MGYRSVMEPPRSDTQDGFRGLLSSGLRTVAGIGDAASLAIPGRPIGASLLSERLDRFMGDPNAPGAPAAYSAGSLLGDLMQMFAPGQGLLGTGSRAAATGNQIGAIFPSGKQALIDALTAQRLKRPFELGSLEPEALAAVQGRRADRGWPARDSDVVRVTPGDIDHMLKRINTDRMTPQSVANMAEAALAPGAAIGTKEGRLNLLPGSMQVQGQRINPEAVLIDGDGYPAVRMYGITPRGWRAPQK